VISQRGDDSSRNGSQLCLTSVVLIICDRSLKWPQLPSALRQLFLSCYGQFPDGMALCPVQCVVCCTHHLLHRCGTEPLEFTGNHPTADAWIIRKNNSATIILTNLAMPRHPIKTELLNLRLSNALAPRTAWIERLDEDHSNPHRLWQSMGEPEYLCTMQIEQLKTTSVLQKESQPLSHELGNIDLAVVLPPQSVAAVTIEFD